MESEFLQFQNISNTGNLFESFIQDLISANVENLKTLAEIILDKKNKIKLKFSKCNLYENVYTVIISCHFDAILISLSKQCKFPRGFPCIWVPRKMVKLCGFYPKFDNDNRQTPDEEGEFSGVESIRFFKKWSGFLGQVVVYSLPIESKTNKIFWSVCSKNSACWESNFVQDTYRLFNPLLTNEKLDVLYQENFHLCAEVLSYQDQNHGAQVLSESPVVTSIGRGCCVYLQDSDKKEDTEKKASEQRELGDQRNQEVQGKESSEPTADLYPKSSLPQSNYFVDFLDHRSLVEFCVKNGLPCDSAIIIEGEHAADFMSKLSAERDFITDQRLEELITNHSESITKVKGNIEHKYLLGNILEGLVVIAEKAGRTFTKKYKFANYTVRTFALRAAFEHDQNTLLSARNEKIFSDFVDKWCVSVNGKEYWQKFLYACTVELSKNREKIFLSEDIGKHIQMADFMINKFSNIDESGLSDLIKQYRADYVTLRGSLTKASVVIVVGPIGCGKSTSGEKIAKGLNSIINKDNFDGFEHIDGDILDLSEATVLDLKGERNNYTIYTILYSLMKGKIPIISTGGGALFSGFGKNVKFELQKTIYDTLGVDVNLILLLPNPNEKSVDFEIYDRNIHDIRTFYAETSIKNVMHTVKSRINRQDAGWEIPDNFYPRRKGKSLEEVKEDPECRDEAAENFCKKIANHSVGNYSFVAELMNTVHHVLTYPIYVADMIFDTYLNLKLDYTAISNLIILTRDIPDVGKFSQHRILAKIVGDNDIHHVTLAYNKERNISLSLKEIEQINKLLQMKEKHGGLLVTLKTCLSDTKNKSKIATCQFATFGSTTKKDYLTLISDYINSFFSIFSQETVREAKLRIEDILPKYAHITISPGRHRPDVMKEATRATLEALAIPRWISGERSVVLPTIQDDSIAYPLSDAEIEPIEILLIKSFAF